MCCTPEQNRLKWRWKDATEFVFISDMYGGITLLIKINNVIPPRQSNQKLLAFYPFYDLLDWGPVIPRGT